MHDITFSGFGDEFASSAAVANALAAAADAAAAALATATATTALVHRAQMRIVIAAKHAVESSAEGAAAAERAAAEAEERTAAAVEGVRAREEQHRHQAASYVAQRVWRRYAARKALSARMAAVVLLAQRAEAERRTTCFAQALVRGALERCGAAAFGAARRIVVELAATARSTAAGTIPPIVATTARLAALRTIARDSPCVAAAIVLDSGGARPPRVTGGGAESAEGGGTLPTLVALFAHDGVQRSLQLLLAVIQTL